MNAVKGNGAEVAIDPDILLLGVWLRAMQLSSKMFDGELPKEYYYTGA